MPGGSLSCRSGGAVSQRDVAACARRPAPARAAPRSAQRRTALLLGLVAAPLVGLGGAHTADADEGPRVQGEYERLGILEGKDYGKTRIKYPDFTLTDSGLQYKDYKLGEGEVPRDGDRLTVDWSGVTLGYYGRPFEARNKPQGSSFAGDDKKYLMFTLGKDQVIPGVEEALRGMKPGGIRRIVVPAELGYPNGDFKNWKPTPSTFAGTRALDFVVKPNPGAMIDKTLLFDLQLVRVTPGEGR